MFPEYVVSIDIGTTKISVLVGELMTEGTVKVVGVGSCQAEGMKKGMVVDMDRAVECVSLAKAKAEKMAGVEIRGVCAGFSGPHVKCFNSRGMIPLSVNSREINDKDLENVTAAASGVTLPVDREIIQVLRQDFILDKQDGVNNPIGMSASRLGAGVHIVTGQRMPVDNISRVLEKSGLEIVNLVFEPLASARAVLSSEEMESGSLVVDMGGGVSSYALFFGGCVRSSGVIAAGGSSMTNDLAIGLRVPVCIAEDIKIRHGVALTSMAGENDVIEVPDMEGQNKGEVRTQILAAIIEPRCEEIFAMIKKAVSSEPFYRMLGGGVVLTGGASGVRGMDTVAEQVFDLPVRIGSPVKLEGLAEMVDDGIWSAGIGLLLNESAGVTAGGSRSRRGSPGDRIGWMMNGLKKIASFF